MNYKNLRASQTLCVSLVWILIQIRQQYFLKILEIIFQCLTGYLIYFFLGMTVELGLCFFLEMYSEIFMGELT